MGKKRKVTVEGLLRLVGEVGELLIPPGSAKEAWERFDNPVVFDIEKYFPSAVKEATGRLLRKGEVEKVETVDGVVMKLTDKGKKKLLKFRLQEFKPKQEKWDGLWRMVFFDVEEVNRKKRDQLRDCLKMLGLKQMQLSVWVGPYDVNDEVRYIREVVGVPHAVKLGLLKEVENDEDLRGWFEL